MDVHFSPWDVAAAEAYGNRMTVPGPRGSAHDDASGLRVVYVYPRRGVVVARLVGAVDLASVNRLRAELASCLSSPQWNVLVLDLSDLEFLGVRGMVALQDASRAAGRGGMALRVVARGSALRALELAEIAPDLELYTSVAGAVWEHAHPE